MRAMSHREYLTWQAWLRKEWNRPSRTDYYLMQLSADVRNLFAKKPVEVEERKISWTYGTATKQSTQGPPLIAIKDDGTEVYPPGPLTAEQIASVQRQVLIARYSKPNSNKPIKVPM